MQYQAARAPPRRVDAQPHAAVGVDARALAALRRLPLRLQDAARLAISPALDPLPSQTLVSVLHARRGRVESAARRHAPRQARPALRLSASKPRRPRYLQRQS